MPEPGYDAGEVSQGEKIVHDFVIGNSGDEPLTVKINDCGCSGVKVTTPKAPIKPGARGTITVTIPTAGRKGAFERKIKFKTDDPGRKELLLTIYADIHEIISIQPSYIDFGRVAKGSVQKKEICVSNGGREAFTILFIEVQPRDAAAITIPNDKIILKPGDKKIIGLTMAPQDKTGQVSGAVFIRTDLKQNGEKKIFFCAEAAE